MLSTIKAVIRMLLFLCICLIVVPIQLCVLLVTKGPAAYVAPHIWHKAVCLIFGIKVQVNGVISTDAQTLFVSNHISYLDIPAIGSVLQNASFIAKKDVSGWPVFGFLSKLQQTAFISRSRADAQKGAQDLDALLDAGKNLTVFPEGTSTDGVVVRPFKSSLFSIAVDEKRPDLLVQPFTIKVLATNGARPETQDERDIYAWHVDMDTELHIHLWRFAKSNGTQLALTFHDPLPVKEYNDRKLLAKACHDTVSNGLEITKAA
jgi:1-acyl-sn-glycerol-3-phosphate acyltransferase